MERFTKIVVLLWTCAALAVQIWLLSSSWPTIPVVAVVTALVSVVAGGVYPGAVAGVLSVSYVFPVVVRLTHGGTPYTPYEGLWMTALVAVMLPRSLVTGWSLPRHWRVPLVMGVMAVVLCAPVVALRETDFNPGLLGDLHAWWFYGPVWPSLVVTWILHTSLTLVVGVLWFDWLYSQRHLDLQRSVLTPLAISAALLALAACYQLFVDLTFLNETVFASIGRASGTMYDANVTGTLAAMWIGGFVLWASRQKRHAIPMMFGGAFLGWLAVWATGSRTAFAAAVIVTVFTAVGFGRGRRPSRSAMLACGALAIAAALALWAMPKIAPRAIGPLARVRATLPSASPASIAAFAAEMWNRNQYGAAATAMTERYPLFGVGIGAYHTIAGDYVPEGALPPDNAQNWLRHLVAESGVIGSIGWLVWTAMFVGALVRSPVRDPLAAWITRGVLVAFGAISMLGVPGQDAVVAITFWSFAFVYLQTRETLTSPQRLSGTTWVLLCAIALASSAGTIRFANSSLRVPVRAIAATWPYSYGFSAPLAGGDTDGFRRTRHHAVSVIEPSSRWVRITVRLEQGAPALPVDVRLEANGDTVLKGRLTDPAPLTAVVELPVGSRKAMIEALSRHADATWWRPDRHGEPPLLVKWEFLDRAPANAPGYPRPLTS